MEKASAQNESLDILNTLRALAAGMVCLFHASFLLAPFSSTVNAALELGQFGVYVFFVISGVVIPLALEKANYHLSDFPVFMAKRIIRLMPPLIASATLIALSTRLTMGIDSIALVKQWLASATLTAPLLHIPWLNEVYWTLFVEMQYYIYIGLLFPILFGATVMRRRLMLALLMAASFLSLFMTGYAQSKLPFQLPVFLIGLVTFFYYRSIISRQEYYAWLMLNTGVCYFLIGYLHGFSYWIGTVAALTSLTIAHVHQGVRLLSAMGKFSYSFYLMHWPVISALCFFAGTFTQSMEGGILTFFAVLILSILVARLFYTITEQPALRWSRRLRYKSRN